MVVHEVKSAAEFKEALKKPLVVVDCYATWCAPCKAIAPKLVEYSEKFPSIHFIKVDVEEVPDVSQELGVTAMPTFFFFKDGDKVDDLLGAAPPKLEAKITSLAA